MTIWGHTLVKNEERYLWFSVMSVIEYIDRILIWDTGSTDNTLRIIKEIKKLYPNKVDFREVGEVNINEFTSIRQKMLEETESDWFMILDGDEVWWDDSIGEAVEFIRRNGRDYDSIVHRYYNAVGDIFHYQEEAAGRYRIDGKTGHLTIRFMNRKIPGLHFAKPHGQQGIFDGRGVLIQERDRHRRSFLDKRAFMHFTNMVRSSSIEKDQSVPKRSIKFKYELGVSFPSDFYYPEVFFRPRPDGVLGPWRKMDRNYLIKALFLTVPRKIKRRVFVRGSGY
jgi:glycosyltransferase involved in cell wall biosynthesis